MCKGIGECRAITLTTAIGENIVGTSGNDTFSAVQGGTAASTLQLGDTIDGGAGTDTLNITVTTSTDANLLARRSKTLRLLTLM